MKSLLLAPLALGVVACVLSSRSDSAATLGPRLFPGCGAHLVWTMPESDIVELTAEDSRSEAVLATQARIDHILLAAEAFCLTNRGQYPASFDAMRAESAQLPDSLRACSLDEDAHVDAWENPIFFGSAGRGLVVISAGPDGVFSTADDIGIPSAGERHSSRIQVAFEAECAGASALPFGRRP